MSLLFQTIGKERLNAVAEQYGLDENNVQNLLVLLGQIEHGFVELEQALAKVPGKIGQERKNIFLAIIQLTMEFLKVKLEEHSEYKH